MASSVYGPGPVFAYIRRLRVIPSPGRLILALQLDSESGRNRTGEIPRVPGARTGTVATVLSATLSETNLRQASGGLRVEQARPRGRKSPRLLRWKTPVKAVLTNHKLRTKSTTSRWVLSFHSPERTQVDLRKCNSSGYCCAPGLTSTPSWLGHVSLDTTDIYAEVNLEMKAKALALCDIPAPADAKRLHRVVGTISFPRSPGWQAAATKEIYVALNNASSYPGAISRGPQISAGTRCCQRPRRIERHFQDDNLGRQPQFHLVWGQALGCTSAEE